jgi:two-component system CheB/CheR fusion protein
MAAVPRRVLDLGLPGFDGYHVARQIRLDPSLKDVRIIAVTGHAQESDREEARKAGFDQYLVKPVDLVFVKSLLG